MVNSIASLRKATHCLIINTKENCRTSGFSHPVGMGRSVENAMIPRFLHPVMDASLRDADVDEVYHILPSDNPSGINYCNIGFYIEYAISETTIRQHIFLNSIEYVQR